MGTIHVFFKLVCSVIDIGLPKDKSCDDYNGSGRHTAIWVKICSTIKLKNLIVVSSLQFCIFQPQPAIQLLQRWSGGRFVGGYGRK